AEASGSPGADVDEPPPPAERAHHEVDGTGQLAAHRAHRSRHRRVLRVQEVDDFERRRDVDTLGAGVALLGEPRVAVVGNSHEGRRMAPKLDVDTNAGRTPSVTPCACVTIAARWQAESHATLKSLMRFPARWNTWGMIRPVRRATAFVRSACWASSAASGGRLANGYSRPSSFLVV